MAQAAAQLAALESLDVSCNDVEGFEPGCRCESLESLSLYSNRLASLDSLPRFPRLRSPKSGRTCIVQLPFERPHLAPDRGAFVVNHEGTTIVVPS